MTTHAHKLLSQRDDPESIAKHAIQVLEKRLESEHGLRVLMGAELEFCVLPNPSQQCDTTFGLSDKQTGLDYEMQPSIVRRLLARDTFFPESRRVNRTYREVEHENTRWKQLEVVFTHTPMRADGSPLPPDCLTLARTIEATRHQLLKPATGYKNKLNQNQLLNRRYFKELRERQISEVCFDPKVKGAFIQNGLHLNLSLRDLRDDGAYLFDKREGLLDQVCNGIGLVSEENLILYGSDYPTLERWSNRYHHPHSFFNQSKEKNKDGAYIENALASASSNPYYAVLLQLAGVCAALGDGCPAPTPNEMDAQPMEMLTPALLYTQFQEGNILRDILNHAEPGLGDRFKAAILKTPPGREAGAIHTGYAARR